MTEPGAPPPAEIPGPLPADAPEAPPAGRSLALHASVAVVLSTWAGGLALNLYGAKEVEDLTVTLSGLAQSAWISGLISLLAVLVFLAWSRERIGDLGFHREGLIRQLAVGSWLGVLIFIGNAFALAPAVRDLLPEGSPRGIDLLGLFDDWSGLWIWIPLVTIKGGFLEELWRVFGLTRFEKAFGRAGLYAALGIGSFVFGAGHLYQGLAAGIGTGFVGLAFGVVYLRRRNAWEAVAAHAVFDLIGISIGYLAAHSHGSLA